MRDTRRRLLDWFYAGLAAVNGEALVARALQAWNPGAPVRLVAIGKAADAMTSGAVRALGDHIIEGLVVAPGGYTGGSHPRMPAQIRRLEAAHPIPDKASLHAGEALLDFIQGSPPDSNWLMLISGGASSVVEVLRPDVTLDQLQRRTLIWLAGGLNIAEINAERRQLSVIKGGGLLQFFGDRRIRALYLSDVPGNDPPVIGSGLLSPSQGSPVETTILADNGTALAAAAAAAARASGGPVISHSHRLRGEAATTGRELARLLTAGPGVHVWGGECTVTLPDNPGTGGRCGHLALAAARALAGQADWCLLAAGTDGKDGACGAAGALVDPGTLQRGRDVGHDSETALANADSGTFLAAAGDLVDTGPTGTNVNDLVIGWKF